MPYIPNTPEQQREMLEAIGLRSLEEIYEQIPPELRLQRPLDLPPALSEIELSEHLAELASRNLHAGQRVSFLGGGAYDHFIPAAVETIAARGEFYTAYTPYQPEASQGSLQAFFEYQTLICQLTGMDVSNASLYEGGSAVAEAVLMARSITGRDGPALVAESLHPEYRQVLATYLRNVDCEIVTLPTRDGTLDVAEVHRALGSTRRDGDAERSEERRGEEQRRPGPTRPSPLVPRPSPLGPPACLVVQHPNFFGCLEEVEQLARAAHDAGALFIVSFDPISLGILKRPGDYGADIAVAEGQSLGTPMSFGGPYLGIMACREEYVRKMPGRIVGETVDREGRRCYVLTLQTREQHIRREKATSNICTNQGLLALRATTYLALMGPQGMREVAELCTRKAHYAAERLAGAGLPLRFDRPFFKEFAVRCPAHDSLSPSGGEGVAAVARVLSSLRAAGFDAGPALGRFYPHLGDTLLVAVTERRTRAQIDCLAAAVQ